jgi:predicted Zn-dependent protease
MKERCLVKDGVLQLVYGDTRMCRYLGIEPTGNYGKVCCDNGTADVKDMRKAGVLELVSFSDFQMDSFDGHFKGEIRLGLLYKEDGSVEELTGGSINGSLIELQKNLVFSKEKYEDKTYRGPLAVLIRGVAVAGR